VLLNSQRVSGGAGLTDTVSSPTTALRVIVHDAESWTMHGVRMLLSQLGVTFDVAGVPGDADLFVTQDEDLARTSPGLALVVGSGSMAGTRVSHTWMHYADVSAYLPITTVVPANLDGATVLATFDSGLPAIVARPGHLQVFPDVFAYLARASTLREHDRAFAESFSWDAVRVMLQYLLELAAATLNKSLVRLWYYPSFRTTNAISFSVDVDHMLAWRIVAGLDRHARAKAMLSAALPYPVQKVLAIAASHRFFGRGLYSPRYMSRSGALIGRLLKALRVAAPFDMYLASLNRVHARGIPITAFCRPADFQREETLERYRFRTSYQPSDLRHIEVGLHFGATIGRTHQGEEIENPYDIDVFREGIPRQVESFARGTGKAAFGARMHHVFGFNQQMFAFLDQAASVVYDSSVFGSVEGTETRACPAGVSLPYFPVLLSDGNTTGMLVKSRFVEVPVAVYESAEMPVAIARRFSSSVVVSEHPDKIRSPIVEAFLRLERELKPGLWRASLRELADWWRARDGLRLECRDGRLRIDRRGTMAPARACVVVTPDPGSVAADGGWRVSETRHAGGRLYVDLAAGTTQAGA